MGDLSLFLPEATVLLGGLVAFTASVCRVRYRVAWYVGVLAALACLVSTSAGLAMSGEPFFEGIYRVDAFSQVLKLGIVGGLLLTLFLAGSPGGVRSDARVDMPIFLFLSALGMMMLVSATELLTLYVALELSAYGLYILAALHRNQRTGSEAGVKYVLYGAASSAVTLYGISLVFGAATAAGLERPTYLADLAQMDVTPMFLVGVFLSVAGVLFKLAVFPFHAWAPDTYEGAPHEAVTFIGTASKVAAVGVLARLLFLAVPGPESLTTTLLILCVASMTVGNLAAIIQKDLKRLIAYSTVAHAGYILIGLVCLSELGVASAIFYALVYVPIVFCAFLVVSVVGRDGSNPTRADLAGLYQRSPLLAVTLLVAMFGLAGIPPTSGFAGKWFLFTAAIDSELFWLVVVGAVNATISLFYYLLVVKEAYLTPPGDRPVIAIAPEVSFAAWVGMALVAVLGFYPRPIWDLAEAAARSVIGG